MKKRSEEGQPPTDPTPHWSRRAPAVKPKGESVAAPSHIPQSKGRKDAQSTVSGNESAPDGSGKSGTATMAATKTKQLQTPHKAAPGGSEAGGKVTPAEARKRLHVIYTKHQPSKLKSIPQLLQKWAGREAELLRRVELKYFKRTNSSNSANGASPITSHNNGAATLSEGVPPPQSLVASPSTQPQLEPQQPHTQQEHGVLSPEHSPARLGTPPPLSKLPWEPSPIATVSRSVAVSTTAVAQWNCVGTDSYERIHCSTGGGVFAVSDGDTMQVRVF